MRELDILLEAYFDDHYTNSSLDEQQAFMTLLAWSDDQLWDLMLGNIQPEDQGLTRVVAHIRKT